MKTVTENEILDYLKSMQFKKAMFGVDKTDVLEKMRTLNNMYKALISSIRDDSPRADGEEAPVDPLGATDDALDEAEKIAPIDDTVDTIPEPSVIHPYNAEKEYSEKVEAVAKAFIDMQEQCDSMKSKATAEAEQIVEDAKIKAQSLISDAQVKIAAMEQQRKAEFLRLENKKSATVKYLRAVRTLVDSLPSIDDNMDESLTSILNLDKLDK